MKRELLKFGLKASFVFSLVVLAVVVSSLAFYQFVVKPSDEDTTGEKTYTVQGTATRKITPDTAEVTVGTVMEDTNILTLQTKASEKVNKALEDIKALGIKDEDIQTSNYTVQPEYDTNGEKIIGYKINISVKVTVRNTNPKDNAVSDVISKATDAGLNEVQNLSYSIDGQEKILEELKLEAIDNAKGKAEKQAKKAGLKLGKVTNIQESYYPMYYGYDTATREMAATGSAVAPEADKGSGGITIQPGQFELSSYITLYFEIK